MDKNALQTVDPEIFAILGKETARQQDGLELIASENFVSEAVLSAMGSTLTNKYAEGLPHKRYYGGCEYVDQAEELAIQRACQLFGAETANVQPHSGAQANMAVYFSILDPQDPFVAMSLNEGGHLTHGSAVNFSGRLYRPVHYGVDPVTHRIDYDAVYRIMKEHRPKLLVAGASAYPRIIDFARLGAMAKDCGARFMTDIAHIAGLVVAGLHPSPVPHADFVTTTTHKTLRGPRGGLILMREADAKLINGRVFPGMQGGPLMHIIAAKAVAFKEALQPEFRTYQQQVVRNAQTLAEEFLRLGYRLISGGTDNHLVLIDVKTSRNITGKQAENRLDAAGMTVNKNMIPQDTESPFVTSGIRIGAPAVTTRGMKEAEMRVIAQYIDRGLTAGEDAKVLETLRQDIRQMVSHFPLYPKLYSEHRA